MLENQFVYILVILIISKLSAVEFEAERGCFANNIVPYKITEEDFTSDQVLYIKQMMAQIHNATCIRWVDDEEQELGSVDIVHFTSANGPRCYSIPRYIGKRFVHYIRLSPGCFEKHVVLHEMLHVLGFDHEHQRADRNCYVSVDADTDRQFDIVFNNYDNGWVERFPYDKYSVMHYKRSNFMQAKEERWYSFTEPLGTEKDSLTALDVWKLLYKFCDSPHFCDVDPLYCQRMDEAERNCITNRPYK